MFKKLFAAMGVGGAEVDTQLTKSDYQPGETLQGEIVIKGGQADQEIEGLTIRLMTEVEVESGEHEYKEAQAIATWHMNERYIIKAGETRRIPFSGMLPLETPLTRVGGWGGTKVWLQTGLEIDNALDASDRDFLSISPTPVQANFMHAMERQGFGLKTADVERGQLNGQGFRSTIGCYQELEYRPAGQCSWNINEIEVSFVLDRQALHILLEVDRHFGGDGFISRSYSLQSSVADFERELRNLFG